MLKTVIIDYGVGNVKSLEFALLRLGYSSILTDDISEIQSADRVIFPGVGAADSAMKTLEAKGLDKVIKNLKQPVLGICLGMQLMCRFSEEGNTNGLGIFDLDVIKFSSKNLKIPQIGWNYIEDLKSDLFQNISEKSYMYLVHSYYVEQNENSIAASDYGVNYCVAFQKNNFYGVQFHPEKSSVQGEQLLLNFMNLKK